MALSKAALEQASNVLAAKESEVKVYWFDPGDMMTRMHQEAFPGEDMSDRPAPESRVPALIDLLAGRGQPAPHAHLRLSPPIVAGSRRRTCPFTPSAGEVPLHMWHELWKAGPSCLRCRSRPHRKCRSSSKYRGEGRSGLG